MKHISTLSINYIQTIHAHEVTLLSVSLDSVGCGANEGTERFLAHVVPIIIFHNIHWY